MAFIMLDPDAISTALGELNSLAGEVTDHKYQHQRRADRTRNAIYQLRNRNLAQLTQQAIEQVWSSLPLGALAWEFNAAIGAAHGQRDRAQYILSKLAERHRAQLAARMLELDDAIVSSVGRAERALTELANVLTLGALERIAGHPESVIGLLDGGVRAYDAALRDIAVAHDALERLRQRTLLLIAELEQPLAHLINSSAFIDAADKLDKGLALEQFGWFLIQDVWKLSKPIEAGLHVGPLGNVVGVALDYLSDKDHSAHSFVSHIYGGGVEAAVSLNPIGAAVNATVPAIGAAASADAWAADRRGDLEGGRWGSEWHQVGAQYSQVSNDANALSSVYKDVGALVLDSHALAITCPALSPVLIPMEDMAGSNSANLPRDATRLGGDALTLLRLPFDLQRSVTDTLIVDTGDAARQLANSIVPNDARQHVDDALYTVTAFTMTHDIELSEFVPGFL